MVGFIRGLAVTSTISLLSVKYFSVDGFLFYHAEYCFHHAEILMEDDLPFSLK